MASSSSSSASLPSGLPTAEVSPALPGPRYLCPQVRPCSRPFLLPRLVFGIGPWMLTEMTMPGAGLWGSQQLRVCVYDLLLSLSVVCMWVSLSFSLLPRELVDGRIYRRSLGIAYCGMGSLGDSIRVSRGCSVPVAAGGWVMLTPLGLAKASNNGAKLQNVCPQSAEPGGTRGVCSSPRRGFGPAQRRRQYRFAYARWPTSSARPQRTKRMIYSAIFISR